MFCGEEYAIKLFNNILENHSDYSVENGKGETNVTN